MRAGGIKRGNSNIAPAKKASPEEQDGPVFYPLKKTRIIDLHNRLAVAYEIWYAYSP